MTDIISTTTTTIATVTNVFMMVMSWVMLIASQMTKMKSIIATRVTYTAVVVLVIAVIAHHYSAVTVTRTVGTSVIVTIDHQHVWFIVDTTRFCQSGGHICGSNGGGNGWNRWKTVGVGMVAMVVVTTTRWNCSSAVFDIFCHCNEKSNRIRLGMGVVKLCWSWNECEWVEWSTSSIEKWNETWKSRRKIRDGTRK